MGWHYGLDEMAKHDPEGARICREKALDAMCDAAGCTRDEFERAKARLLHDGLEGPTDNETWECIAGEPMTMTRATEIIEAAAGADFPDAKWIDDACDYEEEPTGEEEESGDVDEDGKPIMVALTMPVPNAEISREGWLGEFFGWYQQIYGSYP